MTSSAITAGLSAVLDPLRDFGVAIEAGGFADGALDDVPDDIRAMMESLGGSVEIDEYR